MTAPWKRVVKARELTGPNGGMVIVMELECGCLIWQRRKVPARRLRCVTCWWVAQEAKGVTSTVEEPHDQR